MRVTAPVTDYLKRSVLTAVGDLLVGDPLDHDRLPSHTAGTVLTATGTGTKPFWGTFKDALTTIGDIFIRAGIGFTRLPSGSLGTYLKGKGVGVLPAYEKFRLEDTGVHIGRSARSIAGEQVILGVGFESSVVIFIVNDVIGANQNFCWGFDKCTSKACMYMYNSSTDSNSIITKSIYMRRDAGNDLSGEITAMGIDGFTITWALLGACAVEFIYLCLP